MPLVYLFHIFCKEFRSLQVSLLLHTEIRFILMPKFKLIYVLWNLKLKHFFWTTQVLLFCLLIAAYLGDLLNHPLISMWKNIPDLLSSVCILIFSFVSFCCVFFNICYLQHIYCFAPIFRRKTNTMSRSKY